LGSAALTASAAERTILSVREWLGGHKCAALNVIITNLLVKRFIIVLRAGCLCSLTVTTDRCFGLHGHACGNERGDDALKERHDMRILR